MHFPFAARSAPFFAKIAIGLALAALLSAALNQIELAGWLAAGALALLAIGLFFFLYFRLPENDRSAVFSKRGIRRAMLGSLIAAIGVSCMYWYATWWLPWNHLSLPMQNFLADHWRKLDFIPSLFAQLLPMSWRSGFHWYFRGGTYCFPGPYGWESMRYLRAAIPGYFVVFLSGTFFVRLVAATIARAGCYFFR